MARLTSDEVLLEALNLQKEYKKINVHWSLYTCVESICEHDSNVIFDIDRNKALKDAANIDNGKE